MSFRACVTGARRVVRSLVGFTVVIDTYLALERQNRDLKDALTASERSLKDAEDERDQLAEVAFAADDLVQNAVGNESEIFMAKPKDFYALRDALNKLRPAT